MFIFIWTSSSCVFRALRNRLRHSTLVTTRGGFEPKIFYTSANLRQSEENRVILFFILTDPLNYLIDVSHFLLELAASSYMP